MFSRRFALDSAYGSSIRIVANHFSFFLCLMMTSVLVCGAVLALFGLINHMDLIEHAAAWVYDGLKAMPAFAGQADQVAQDAECCAGILQTMGVHFQNLMHLFMAKLHSLVSCQELGSYMPRHVFMQAAGDQPSMSLAHTSFGRINYNFAGMLLFGVLPTGLVVKLLLELVSVGWIKIALDLQANKTVSMKYLYQYYFLVPKLLVVNVCVFVATLVGCVFFIVPGVIVFQRLRFAQYFVVDKNMGIVQALRASWKMTDKAVGQLVGYSMIAIILHSLSCLLVVVSLFLIPLSRQVDVNVYSQLNK